MSCKTLVISWFYVLRLPHWIIIVSLLHLLIWFAFAKSKKCFLLFSTFCLLINAYFLLVCWPTLIMCVSCAYCTVAMKFIIMNTSTCLCQFLLINLLFQQTRFLSISGFQHSLFRWLKHCRVRDQNMDAGHWSSVLAEGIIPQTY